MEIEKVFLAVHVGGAGVMGVLLVWAVVMLMRPVGQIHKQLFWWIVGVESVQLVSGLILTLVAAGGIGAYCIKAGVYLGIAAVVQMALAVKMMPRSSPYGMCSVWE